MAISQIHKKTIAPPIFLQTLQTHVISEMKANTKLKIFKNTKVKECKTYIIMNDKMMQIALIHAPLFSRAKIEQPSNL